ncbi:MAG: Xaa-Pro peptidase family protein [Syntrophales bacterium]|nr:Xaa-Pro peptidase family protein [Syntrophales bacterium]
MKRATTQELRGRIGRLQMQMSASGIDGALIAQNADLFYFTGTVQQGYLYVPATGDAIFFVRKIIDRVREESSLEKIVLARSPKEIAHCLPGLGYISPKKMGLELDVLPYNHFSRLQRAFSPEAVVDISPSIRSLRAVKSPYEQEIMRDVARLSDLMMDAARSFLKEGMTELELQASVEALARTAGHQGIIRSRTFNQENYWGQLLSGPDAALASFANSPTGGRGLTLAFPKGAGTRVIRSGDPVMMDLMAGRDGYIVDQTRILSVGPLSAELMRAYEVALRIQRDLGRMIAPGTAVSDLYDLAVATAETHGLGTHFMGFGPEKELFCGHGVGIELDELPVIMHNSADVLVPGMVFALEPKFIFPGVGVVGVEDTFIVTESGSEKITNSSYSIK